MKNIELMVILFFGFSFLVCVFTFTYVSAAKLESGVTINPPSTTEPCGPQILNQVQCMKSSVETIIQKEKCPLEIVMGVPVNYGQIAPGNKSLGQMVVIKNAGISGANVMIWATDWVSDVAGNSNVFGADITRVDLHYPGDRFPLQPSGKQMLLIGIGPQETKQLWFRLYVPPNAAPGSYLQEVTLEPKC